MNNSVILLCLQRREERNLTRAGGGRHIVPRDYCVAKLLLKERNVLGTKHQSGDGTQGRVDHSNSKTPEGRH